MPKKNQTALVKRDHVNVLLDPVAPRFQKHFKSEDDAKSFKLAVYSEFRKSEKLQKCTFASIVESIDTCAQMRLMPGTALQHAWFIPYGSECSLSIGYQGLAELVYRAGNVKKLESAVVYERDEFDYALGTKPFIHHKPTLGDERGEPIACYAVATLADGMTIFELAREDEIQKIKAKSKGASSSSSPWQTFPDEMRKKSVLRRLIKRLQKSADDRTLTVALAADNADFDFAPKKPEPIKQNGGGSLREAIGAQQPEEEPAPVEHEVGKCDGCHSELKDVGDGDGECQKETCKHYGVRAQI